MERYIDKVKKSIAAKEPPLKVAETRLSKRSKVLLQLLQSSTQYFELAPLFPLNNSKNFQSKPILLIPPI